MSFIYFCNAGLFQLNLVILDSIFEYKTIKYLEKKNVIHNWYP